MQLSRPAFVTCPHRTWLSSPQRQFIPTVATLSSSRANARPPGPAPLQTPKNPRVVHHAQSRPTAPSTPSSSSHEQLSTEGIRINKCFKSFASRRESDWYIQSGRVTINGKKAQPGARVVAGDEVCLDNRVIAWERLTLDVNTDDFIYIKHWKRADVLCTTDTSFENNIIDEVSLPFPNDDRIFPIGRLDETSTGIILLTSDGRLPNSVLGANAQSVKEYLVVPDMYVTDEHVQQLRKGVVINTVAQRDRNVRKPLVARTLPCDISRGRGYELIFRLHEGRNRQIRKMLGVLGYTTRDIHRISFMGITLHGLSGPGDSQFLNEDEMKLVRTKLQKAQDSQ